MRCALFGAKRIFLISERMLSGFSALRAEFTAAAAIPSVFHHSDKGGGEQNGNKNKDIIVYGTHMSIRIKGFRNGKR